MFSRVYRNLSTSKTAVNKLMLNMHHLCGLKNQLALTEELTYFNLLTYFKELNKVSENKSYSYTLWPININIVSKGLQCFQIFGSLCTASPALYGSRIKPQWGKSIYAIIFENWSTNIFLRYFLLFSIYQAPYIFALNFWNSPVWNIEFDEVQF